MEEGQYLWDGSSPHWVLVRLDWVDRMAEGGFIIINALSRIALIIEDDATAQAVKDKMIQENVPILTVEGFEEMHRKLLVSDA